MGTLDDAIREHLELKKRSGASEEEVTRLQTEAFGAAAAAAPPAAPPAPEAEPVAEEHEVVAPEPEPVAATEPAADDWLEDDPDEVPASDALDHRRQPTTEFTAEEAHAAGDDDYVAPDEEGEDLLEETPDFLQETPEHDRLWFEQKPPRDFDFDQ